jgi:hypothetical protein
MNKGPVSISRFTNTLKRKTDHKSQVPSALAARNSGKPIG